MSNLWLTSDLHLGHANIIKYCNRPFKDVDEMEAAIIRKWNERIKPWDTVIHVGDFCFKNSRGGKEGEGRKAHSDYYLSKLNGRITFIQGNHDSHNSLNTKIINLVLEYGNHYYFVTHDPNRANVDHPVNLVGHVHEKWKIIRAPFDPSSDKSILYNVGVDVHNFYPVSMQEIIRDISEWKRRKKNENN